MSRTFCQQQLTSSVVLMKNRMDDELTPSPQILVPYVANSIRKQELKATDETQMFSNWLPHTSSVKICVSSVANYIVLVKNEMGYELTPSPHIRVPSVANSIRK
jgi:hypothetical protein